MENKIYLKDFPCYDSATEKAREMVGKNPYFDLEQLTEPNMREEARAFILYRGNSLSLITMYGDRRYYNNICKFIKKKGRGAHSFADMEPAVWERKLRGWMLENHLKLTEEIHNLSGNTSYGKSKLILYFEKLLKFSQDTGELEETEKDIWELEKLDVDIRWNPITNFKILNFTKIYQLDIQEEVKKAIYMHLRSEAVATVAMELTAVPNSHLHTDLGRLRAVLETVGKIYQYPHLDGIVLNRDIPPTPPAEFKTYSDAEMKRINACLAKQQIQIARLMAIHQMLGTRISDTLTLRPDCLYEKHGDTIIRIKQMKTHPYEKIVSKELAMLIRAAIEDTRERYGDTKYIFVNEKNLKRPMQYTTIQYLISKMIRDEDLRDDNGNLFGFNSHMYRHYYGVKLTEMHLDDWTIARLLGHSSIRNVRYYRKMSNQLLADETRAVRNMLSEMILENLDGWGEEYDQIRQDDSLE